MPSDDPNGLLPTEGESEGVWWAGIAVASVVTFVCIGGFVLLLTALLNHLTVLEVPSWPSIVVAAIATILLVRAAVRRGDVKYRPSE